MKVIYLLFLNALFKLGKCTDPRIIGGVLSKPTQFPWVVALHVDPGGIRPHLCTGSIITNTWVITAAHCYRRAEDPDEVTTFIHAGTIDFRVDTDETQNRTSVRNIIHDYNPTRNDTDANWDVALIQVDKPFVFNEFVNFIPIAMDFPRMVKLNCISMGFGRDQPMIRGNSKLFHIESTAGDYIYCRKMHPKRNWTEEHLCVDPVKEGTATCSGDSGGPLVCNNLLTGTLFGKNGPDPDLPVPPCATPGNFQIYMKVAFFKSWIKKYIPELPPMKSLQPESVRAIRLRSLEKTSSATVIGVSALIIVSSLSILVVSDRTSS